MNFTEEMEMDMRSCFLEIRNTCGLSSLGYLENDDIFLGFWFRAIHVLFDIAPSFACAMVAVL